MTHRVLLGQVVKEAFSGKVHRLVRGSGVDFQLHSALLVRLVRGSEVDFQLHSAMLVRHDHT